MVEFLVISHGSDGGIFRISSDDLINMTNFRRSSSPGLVHQGLTDFFVGKSNQPICLLCTKHKNGDDFGGGLWLF